MKLITAPLNSESSSSKIVNLQAGLLVLLRRNLLQLESDEALRLADDITQDWQERRYNDATRSAVIAFQRIKELNETGEIDEATANNLNEDLQVLGVLDREVLPIPMPSPLHKYVVRGQVKTSDGQPIAGSIVQVFDRDLRREQPLDEVVTDADGKYEIRYSPQQLLCPELGRGDLTVRVVHNDQPLVSHPTIYGAGSEEIANLTADMPLPTEFHQLHTKLQPLLGDVPIPDLTDPDLTYLAGTAGLQTEQVLNLKKSEIYGNETQIPANVFYAWFQQGLPTDLDSLLTQKGSSLRRALQNAAEANQLPAELRDRQDEFIDQVTQLRVEQVLKPGTNGRASLGDLLGTVRLQLDQNKQQIFANRWVSYEGDSEQFWNTLQDQFNPNEITDLRLTTELGTLTGNHLSLIRELQKVRPADATSLRYLVEKDLPQLVQSVGVPSDIPGTGEEQRQYYVEQLEYHLENQFPTALIAARIKQNQFVVPANIRSQVANFFNQNQDFEFGKQHISAYLQGANLAGIASEDVPSLKAELMSIERIFNLIPPAPALNLTSNGADQTVVDDSQSRNIGQNQGNAIHGALTDAATPRDIPFSPRYPLASALRQAGFDSAHQIVSHGRQNFRNAVSLRLPGGEKIAEVLFDQASHKSAMVQAMFSKYGKRFNSTDLAILPGFNPTPEQEQELTKHIPEWRELFGNIDFCKCEHCQSVYGPAAYLVEILQFLGQCKLSDGQTLQTRLFNSSRRPDLGEIQLTCKNTNTEMPYVDLVNEILENAVFPRSDQNGNVPYPQTTWTSDELAANPENLYVPAYDRLKQATFPWTLPFDLWVEQARIYLEHIGIRRYELMETLKPDQRFLDMAVAQEHLGLIKEEADLITTVDSSDSWKYWGLEERNNILKDPRDGSDVTGEWWAVLKHVSILLKQSGLTYPELLNLLNLRCINPSNIQPTIEDDSCSLDNCNLSKMQVSWLYGPIFAEIQAFTRLWRRLGWSMHDLDRAIMAFYGSIRSGNPDVNTLLFISHVQRLKEKLNISVSTILLWCIPNWVHKIDTWLYLDYSKDEQIIIPSLYDQLFQNYTVISPPDEAFKLTPSRDELNKFKDASNQNQPLPTISEHQVSVIAALGITAKDLSLLLPNNLSLVSYGSGCEDRLNLDNLSCLYRIVSFAKALRLSVQDWFRVVALTGVYPFPVMAQHPEPRVKIFQLIEEVDRIRKSGFSIAEVDYLIRHQTIGAFGAMPVEAQISQALSRIRSGLQQIDTETQLQPDLDGKLTQKMLSRLGWDVGLIELLMSGEYLNSPLFIEAPLDHLPTDLRFPDSLPECLKSRLSFNQQSKKIVCRGGLTIQERQMLYDLLPDSENQDYTDFKTSINILQQQTSDRISRIRCKMQSFKLPLFSVSIPFEFTSDLAALPAGVTFPDSLPEGLKQRVFYNATNGGIPKLCIKGLMSEREWAQLIAIAPDDTTFTDAVEKLFVPVEFPQELTGKFYYDPQNKTFCLLGWFTPREYQQVLGLSKNQAYGNAVKQLDQNSTNYKEQNLSNQFLQSDGQHDEVEKLVCYAQSTTERFEIILRRLLPYLRQQASQELLVQQLSQTLKLEPRTVTELLQHRIHIPTRKTEWAISSFLDPSFASSTTKVPPTITAFPEQFATYTLLHKIAFLFTKFSMTPEDVTTFFTDHDWQFLNNLPLQEETSGANLYENWRRLAMLVQLRDELPSGRAILQAIFKEVKKAPNSDTIDDILKQMAKLLQWNLDDLRFAVDKTRLNLSKTDDYTNPEKLLQLKACFDLLKRLGASAEQAWAWAGDTLHPEDATAIKQVVRAKFDSATWLERAKPLRNQLRERQRSALVDYLVAHDQLRDANDLYGIYLIDVEMSPCMMTSRIKQAISSVQLFIQRCLMNLEPNISPSAIDADHLQQWKTWMKSYRIWEANRKVLLYPENWIEPELRDDKSPFFKELESELQQGDVTKEMAGKAFLSYLEKLESVARLDIVGFCYTDTTGKSLHVFGRTYSTPYVYYHRQLVDGLYWTAWERIELDIEGDHLIPYSVNGITYLFWPIFKEVATSQVISANSTIPAEADNKRLQIYLAWSQYKNGKWAAKQVSTVSLDPDNASVKWDVERRSIRFGLSPQRKSLDFRSSLDIYSDSDSDSDNVMSYDFYNFSKLCSGTFTLDGLSDASTLIVEPKYPTTDDRLCYYPLETQIEGMNFKSKDPIRKPGLTLSFHVPPDPLFIKKKVFNKTPSEYRLLFNADNNTPFYISHHDYSIFHRSFFYKDRENTILIQSSYNPEVGYKLMFQTFMHTHVRIFIEELKAGGIDRLLALDTQERLLYSSFKDYDPNSEVIDLKLEYTQKADFTKGGAYSIYNWELFFHAPFLIANHLSKNQRFAEAQQWFHYIFDPTTNSSYPTAARYWRMREFHEYAKRPPIEELMVLLAKSADEQTISPEQQELIDQVEIWRQNPFKPHAIARWRTSAYQKVVVMKYLDNLIAWGDQLFRRDTIETINEATQLYILADQILGRRPEQLPRRTQPLVHTYNALVKDHVLDSFSNALVEAENLLPPSRTTVSTGQPITPPTLLFCIPPNDKLLEYWNTVSDRLFKIRHCMNIAGIVRKLPLFEPPIDPALLVKAAAAGIDISSALSDRNAPLPYYRFNILVQKASELCSEVKSMGAALLSALEKKDAEQIALLRSSHEISLLEATRAIKILQVEEAKASLEALTKSLESPGARLRYYMQLLSAVETIVVEPTSQEPLGERLLTTYTEFVDTLSLGLDPSAQAIKASLQLKEIVTPVAKKALDQLEKTLSQEGGVDFKLTTPADPSEKVTLPMNPYEKRQLDELRKSHDKQKQAMDYELLAQVLALIPDLKIGCPPTIGATFGGTFLSTAARVFANQFNYEATEYSYRANLHSILAGYQRRFAEWILQARTAVLEIEQISAQIATAGIRSAITKAELDNHTRQIDNAKAVDALMHEKYTNQELYEWMIGQISSNYLASYQLAYDVAKRAERAYRFELGLTDSNFIQFGYWDNLKKGLLAGESLYHDLKRMEIAYLDQNKREYEITKQVSLKLHNPLALITLKENGICEIELPEALFDADYPGHYMRRIKSVSLSIPCVTGPYTSINCTLTLLTNKTRIKNIADENYGQPEENEGCFVTNFAATQSIATSTAQNDSGMFEVNFRDERYLPFEGAGAISRWRIDMPKDCNAFDFDTISDVILKLNYTAREGGEILRQAARRSLNLQVTALSSLPHGEGPMRMFSLRHEFPAEWNQFFHPSNHATAQSMDLKISKEQFPFQLRGQTGIQITKVDMFLKLKEISETEPPSPSSLDLILFQPSSDTTEGNKIKLENITPNPGQASGKLLYGHCTTTGGWGTWSLKIQEAGITPLNKAIEDIILICHYSVSQQGNP